MKNKIDLRILKTKRNIHSAFKEMICEMDFEKITVKELSFRAGINCKTFYFHYDSLNDLLKEFQSEMAEEFILRTQDYRSPLDLDKITREFFLVCESSILYEKLICSNSYEKLGKSITENIIDQTWKEKQGINPEELGIIMTFVSRSTIEIYKHWVKNGREVSLEKIINLTSQLVSSGLKGVLEEK